eukprot:TCALIF_10327-PA protein Name:"Similar to FR FMRFamide receptor (Drosophila melanogaster)" AED:0.29 eAED:0.30 QI:13/0/0/1/1/0.5/2/0/145
MSAKNSSVSSLEAYYSGEDNHVKVFFEFVLHGIVLNLIGVIGLVGNIICIAILSRPHMKSSTNLILCALASFDVMVILCSMFMLSLPAIYRYTEDAFFTFYYQDVFPYITPCVYSLGLIAQTGSIYSTLCVTVERYIVICWPLRE